MATILELAQLSAAAYGAAPVIGSTPVSGWTVIAIRTLLRKPRGQVLH